MIDPNNLVKEAFRNDVISLVTTVLRAEVPRLVGNSEVDHASICEAFATMLYRTGYLGGGDTDSHYYNDFMKWSGVKSFQ